MLLDCCLTALVKEHERGVNPMYNSEGNKMKYKQYETRHVFAFPFKF
jgi:hypothetical protein